MEPHQAQPRHGRFQEQKPPENDRSKARNVLYVPRRKTKTDWEYLNDDGTLNNASSDKIFDASYKKQGLQPRGLNVNNEDYRNKDQRQPSSILANNNSKRLSSTKKLTGNKINRATKVSKSRNKRSANSSLAVAKRNLARGRASFANGFIFLFGGKLYLFVQLPLALISSAILVVYVLSVSGGLTVEIINFIAGLDDISLGLLMLSTVLVHLLGLFTLFMIATTYSTVLLKPISGNGGSLKWTAFLTSFFLYSIPISNLLPWGLLYVGAVWLYPE